MWTRYDAALVRRELAVLAEHGCDVTRCFCYWPDFVPAPERLDPDVLERFEDFLDAHVECGLHTLPTLVVGHMSGENWNPVWRAGRDLYRDVWLVSQQAWLASELAARFGGHPAVAGWVLSNEMPLYGGPAASEEATAWARILLQALRAGGATQPVSTGDGAWGVEVTGVDNGFSLRTLAPLVDFVGPHVYPMQDDEVRQLLSAAFVCELAGSFERPVVLEEFGATSDFASDEHAAAYYRQVLYTSLLAGARGWLAWCSSDYDELRGDDPYRHHPFETHFGLTDRNGLPKPQLLALSEFASFVRRLERHGWERVGGEVALIVPEHFERVLPFASDADRADLRKDLLQAYVAAREADLPVGLVRERDGLPGAAHLYLVPSAKLLTGPGLDRLLELAHGGATVYASYFAGSTPQQRGPWFPSLNETFGVRHRLRYGLVDPIVDDRVVLEFVRGLGDIAPGTRLWFHVSGTASARSYLPVDPAGADVVAVDGHGHPALLCRRIGSGRMVLSTYPLEHMAARRPGANPESTWRLYSALADVAGVPRPVRVADPRVLVGRLRSGNADTVLFINSSNATIVTEPVGGPIEPLVLEPYGVAAMPSPPAKGVMPVSDSSPLHDQMKEGIRT